MSLVRTYHNHALALRREMESVDTGIRFSVMDGTLYVVRNLLDGHFHPYASVIMMCDPQAYFMPINAVSKIRDVHITLDDHTFRMTPEGTLEYEADPCENGDVYYETIIEDHVIAFRGTADGFDAWAETPWLRRAVLLIALLVIPLLTLVVYLFYRNVTRPLDTLAEAHRLVQEGRRGYEIGENAPNSEFQKLYNQFNAMSREPAEPV